MRSLAALILCCTLAACGFKLRGEQNIPLESLFIQVPLNSPIGAEISRNLRGVSQVKILTVRKDAQAIFELLGEQREREVLAINAQGRAREYQLRLTASFRVLDQTGNELLPVTTVMARRDISINETDFLARESEEALLYRDMQTDLVRQMINRLAAIKPDAG
ncbi:MAG: LPS assembly lipoprotein LptE [Burkholderiaceae bacterium]